MIKKPMLVLGILFNTFFFLALACILYETGHLFAPFFGPLLCAAVLATVFYPLHRWLGRRRYMRDRPSLHAFVSDAIVFFFFVIPMGFLIWALAAQLDTTVPLVKTFVERSAAWIHQHSFLNLPGIQRLPGWLSKSLDITSSDVQSRMGNASAQWMSRMALIGTAALKGAAGLVLDIFLLLFALFFFFRDGERWYAAWNELLPLRPRTKERLDGSVQLTVAGVVRGTFLTSLAQGVCAGIGFTIAGAKPALLLGTLTFVTSLVPSVGTALVWVPVSVYFFVSGAYWRGLFMVGWGMIIVGLIDNLARPLVVGNKADLPFFWLFFSILGGLNWYGLKGLLLGPLLVSIAMVFLDIYRESYLGALPSKGKDLQNL